MITATFKENNKLIHKFIIEGHANFAPTGQDIVCAAVSSLVLATCNALLYLEECEVADEDGLLVCTVKEPSEITNTLMQPLLIGLNGIAEKHPNHLKVISYNRKNSHDGGYSLANEFEIDSNFIIESGD